MNRVFWVISFVLLIIIIFTPIVYQYPLGCGDSHLYSGPYCYYLDHFLHNGKIPLWNPLTLCGMPTQAYVTFYPLNLVRSLLTLNPTPTKTHISITIYILVHLIIGGYGTFVYTCNHKLSSTASTIAAIGYMLNTNMCYRAIGYCGFVFACAWLPWAFLALDKIKTTTHNTQQRWGALLGVSMGMMCLTGAFQIFLIGFFALACWWILDIIINHYKIRPSDLYTRGLATTICVLLSAIVLLPTWQLSTYCDRSLLPQNTPIAAAENIVWPTVSMSILALIGCFSSHTRYPIMLALLFGVLLTCALDIGPFAWVLNAISPFQTSNPTRAILIAHFPLSVLAAYGIDKI